MNGNAITATDPKLIVTVSDSSLLTKLKNAIKLLNGVEAISVVKPRKTEMDLAREDAEKGNVIHWNSVDEMFKTILGK